MDEFRCAKKPVNGDADVVSERTCQLARVFDEMTVRQNMLVPTVPRTVSRADSTRRAEALLETATLDRVKSSPAAEISGGQKKLLEFVRTMMTDPALILLDEPFNGRSEEHTSELQSLMRISYAVFCLKKKTMMSANA